MIETERLLLREYTLDDFDSLYEIYQRGFLAHSNGKRYEKSEGISRPEEYDFLCFCHHAGRMEPTC